MRRALALAERAEHHARHNHRIAVVGGVLAGEAGTRLTNYFRRKRGKPAV